MVTYNLETRPVLIVRLPDKDGGKLTLKALAEWDVERHWWTDVIKRDRWGEINRNPPLLTESQRKTAEFQCLKVVEEGSLPIIPNLPEAFLPGDEVPLRERRREADKAENLKAKA